MLRDPDSFHAERARTEIRRSVRFMRDARAEFARGRCRGAMTDAINALEAETRGRVHMANAGGGLPRSFKQRADKLFEVNYQLRKDVLRACVPERPFKGRGW